jgi:hypothetical protein
MNLELIERVVLGYLDKHPEVVERLVERLVEILLDRLAEGRK